MQTDIQQPASVDEAKWKGTLAPATGSAWRIRQLIDGRYVAEERRGWIFKTWVAVDLKSPNFCWDVNDKFYRDCIGDAAQCLKALAGRGHSMPNDQADR
jgi:hypothetical protein